MKRNLLFFLWLIGCCLLHCILFGQDSTSKIYQIKFSGYKTKLSREAIVTLNHIADIMKSNPGFNFKVVGYSGNENERFNVANWDRVNNTITYLVEKKRIKADRLIFNYGDEGKDCNAIELQWTEEKPPPNSPPPHPNLRKKNY
jgi:hypothetical protein